MRSLRVLGLVLMCNGTAYYTALLVNHTDDAWKIVVSGVLTYIGARLFMLREAKR